MDTALLAFVGISVLLAITPGPDMAVVTKNALAHGRRGVVLTTTGIALALAIWITATAVGLSALLRASGEAFLVIKLVGAAYLAYLGVRTLIDSRRRPAQTANRHGVTRTLAPRFSRRACRASAAAVQWRPSRLLSRLATSPTSTNPRA